MNSIYRALLVYLFMVLRFAYAEMAPTRGDMNLDGSLDFGDISGFTQALEDPDAYLNQFQLEPRAMGDINCDGEYDFNDIVPFINLLGRSGLNQLPACPVVNTCNPVIDSSKTLLIKDLSVVNNPRARGTGPWSFYYLMSQMTPSGMSTDDFIKQWMDEWSVVTSVNSNTVPTRSARAFFNIVWPRNSTGQFIPEQAPFRLLAIVFRPDLRNAERAGEGRLVFGITDASGTPLSGTVIFEYSLPLVVMDQNSWNLAWQNLSSMSFNSPLFNPSLEQITRLFTDKNEDLANHPFQNALSQLRTNETIFSMNWELREFVLGGRLASGLGMVTTKKTPDISFNLDPVKRSQLVNWILQNQALVLAGEGAPDVLPSGLHVTGGFAPQPVSWLTGLGIPENVRKAFATNTCNGCHTNETFTGFTHISPRSANAVSFTSQFVANDLIVRSNVLRDLINELSCQ